MLTFLIKINKPFNYLQTQVISKATANKPDCIPNRLQPHSQSSIFRITHIPSPYRLHSQTQIFIITFSIINNPNHPQSNHQQSQTPTSTFLIIYNTNHPQSQSSTLPNNLQAQSSLFLTTHNPYNPPSNSSTFKIIHIPKHPHPHS